MVGVHDTTAPAITAGSVVGALGLAKVAFSEKVDKASAEEPGNYAVDGNTVLTARLAADGRSVLLTLGSPLPAGQTPAIRINGVKDLARRPNTVANASYNLTARGAVLSQDQFEPNTTKSFNNVEGLPAKAKDSWTVNLFCKIDKQPEDRVLIGGFGRSSDGRTGTGRYFAKFSRGINFWIANMDVMTNTPLDIGKWQMLTATYDGTTVRVYKNGVKIGEEVEELADDAPQARVMPLDAWERQRRFGGEVRGFTVWDQDLPEAAIRKLYEEGIRG
jgi:alpha-mannosidase